MLFWYGERAYRSSEVSVCDLKEERRIIEVAR